VQFTGLRRECTEATFPKDTPPSLLASLLLSVVILLADGARPDTLDAALTSGALPNLARMRDEGGALHRVTSCFPSVTGPAYAPFLMGRFPGPIGLPGLRWFDRARAACTFPDYTRSYVGYQLGAVDRDVDVHAPTIFELCSPSLGALNVIGRGLPKANRIGALSASSALRAARTHFTGNVAGWLDIDRDVADAVVRRIRLERPEFVFAALTGVDKVSHARGQSDPMIKEALRIVDDAAGRIRRDAEQDGRWRDLSLWVVSDHGHSRVSWHEDLVRVVQRAGFRTRSHPWVFTPRADVGVMVSGNAMAHLYLDVRSRARPAALDGRWNDLRATLLALASVDLMMMPAGNDVTIVTAGRGSAVAREENGRFSYRRVNGDPLGVGRDLQCLSPDDAYDAMADTDYPDGLVQLLRLALAPRSGEIILSAAREWDFRARHEPIPHVSSHGALHREHMLVPLFVNREIAGTPRRTVDVMPSALAALGKPIPPGLDGESFV
jgi:type I phosphodiesterase/nucleotide pyrophosphatase